MNLFRKIQSIKVQIVDTERLLEMVNNHPLMSESLTGKLNELKRELASLPKESLEPKVQLLFSGNAVIGSQGIKSSFVSKVLTPFQEMVKTQVALERFGHVGKRGQAKRGSLAGLYLTALPVGSFGVELSQLENDDFFESIDVSKGMKEVMSIISSSSIDDETFENTLEKIPGRSLANLKTFLQEVAAEKSVLKMESGEVGIEISKEKVEEAYQRVSSTTDEENEIIISGTFRGLLLDSGKFEILNDEGHKLSGSISDELDEERLIDYDKMYLNTICEIHLRVHKTRFKTGNIKTDYELLEIKG
jgi:hypothetical protein